MEAAQARASNKDRILKAFQQLLSEQQQGVSRIATKQEAAEREEDKKIVGVASTYTAESIVKGLADLQLNFGAAVDKLIAQLAVEAPKLEQLRRAIHVETQHVKELHDVRIAADALDILIQEHQERMKTFGQKSQQERQTLDKEMTETKQAWQKEQKEFETAQKEQQGLLKKQRKQEETDYQYDLERKRKIEADEYAERKAALERQIAEAETKKETDWTEREGLLAVQQESLEKYRTLAASFPKELEEATQKARDDAIQEVYEEAKVQADLFEKEVATNKEVAELKIQSLEGTVEQQNKQIEHLSAQLQIVLKQVQELASKAVAGREKTSKT